MPWRNAVDNVLAQQRPDPWNLDDRLELTGRSRTIKGFAVQGRVRAGSASEKPEAGKGSLGSATHEKRGEAREADRASKRLTSGHSASFRVRSTRASSPRRAATHEAHSAFPRRTNPWSFDHSSASQKQLGPNCFQPSPTQGVLAANAARRLITSQCAQAGQPACCCSPTPLVPPPVGATRRRPPPTPYSVAFGALRVAGRRSLR